ncbi:MAG TPA: hypothetical protein VGY58_16690, partial [Gemmataceae bacterium]|nr:hypothetical protein [Gemmataceae bacterium]
MPELRDLLGAGGDAGQVPQVEAGMIAESVTVIAVVQPMQGRCRQPNPPVLPLCLCRLQPITQRHQLVHLGDDAMLLGVRWEPKNETLNILSRYPGNQTSRGFLQGRCETVSNQ